MCYAIYYFPHPHLSDEKKHVCYLHDRESAKEFAEIVEDKENLMVFVEELPLVEARQLRIPYINRKLYYHYVNQ